MSDFDSHSSHEQRPLSAAHVAWAVLILATLYCSYFSNLGVIGYVGPDEPRYAWIAREMAESGDWVTPRLYGKPWFEKPVLYYWGAALSFKLFGVSEKAARLPSAISALGATLALAWLASRIYGVGCALWLSLLLPTSVGMIGFARGGSTDMPFSGMLTVAMVCGAAALGLTHKDVSAGTDWTPWPALALFGFFLGLATLAKGPAAVVLAGGAVFSWAVFTKRWRETLRLLHPIALATFFGTAFPWYIICARRNPDFFQVFIVQHNFKRYLTPEFQHIQPFYFYGPILLIGVAPWFLMPLCEIFYAAKKKFGLALDHAALFFVTWAAFPVLFFSVSKSKLPGYILPAIPPLVFLAAHFVSSILPRHREYHIRGIAALAFVPLLGVAAVSFALFFGLKGVATPRFAFAGISLALGGMCACLIFVFTHKRAAALLSGAVVWAAFLALTLRMELPWLDPVLSPRPIARILREHPEEAQRVLAFRLHRGWQYALNFYLHRELLEWTPARTADALVLVSPQGITELRRLQIPFEVLDRTCLEAQLVRLGPLEQQNPAPEVSPNFSSELRLVNLPSGSRQP